MKLVYEDLNSEIVLEENDSNIFVIENPALFRSMVESLVKQIEGSTGKFVLSKAGQEISISKNVEIVLDVFHLEMNKRKVLTKLYEELNKKLQSENMFSSTMVLKGHINKYLYDLLQEVEWEVGFNEEFDMIEIFKAVSLRFEDNGQALLEKIVAYMNVAHIFLKVEVMVFVNLVGYLTTEELKALQKEAAYKKIHLIFFEGMLKEKIYSAKVLIVDRDLCEIMYDI